MSSVLYDAPGPRARRRIMIASVVGVVVVALILGLAVKRLYDQDIFAAERWDIFSDPEVWEALGRGLFNTLRVAAIAAVLAVLLGAVLTALRLTPSRWLSVPARLFIELFRGLPVLLLMFIPIVLFTSVTAYMGAIIGLTLYNGAIIAEILRSGVRALPSGQREAGLAVGLTPMAALRLVELPQAVRIMLPTLISQLVVLLKDSSLAYIISYPELLQEVRSLSNFYGNDYLFPLFFVGAGIYIAINMTFSQTASYLSRRGTRKAAR
jgi:glutamate transport system permease protein